METSVISDSMFKMAKDNFNIDPVKTGKFIAKLRVEHNLTQENLGESVFVTRKAVSKWETGRCTPSLDTLKQLTTVLDVSLEELIAGDYIENIKEPKREFIIKILHSYWLKILGIILALLIVIVIGVVFVYNLIADKSYLINYEDGNFAISNGIIVLTANDSYISLGNFYYNISNVDNNTSFDIELFYFDKLGNEITIIKFNGEQSVLLDMEIRNKLKKLLSSNDIENLYYKVSFVDKNGDYFEYDLNLKISKKTAKDIPTVYSSDVRLIDETDVEDGINLNFLFSMDEDDILYLVEKSNNKSRTKTDNYSISYDFSIKTLNILTDEGSIVISFENKRILFYTDNAKSFIINDDNIVAVTDLIDDNYNLLKNIAKYLLELSIGYSW